MKEITYLHDCLLIKNTLIIGDLHLGYDEQFHGKAVFPGSQLEDIIKKLDKVFEKIEYLKIKLDKIILLGDVKHDFGVITDIEWRETLMFFDFLLKKVDAKCKIIITKGNHDNILMPITKKRNILLKDYHKMTINKIKICFLHGNKLFKQCLNSDYLVFGHLHPAITLSDNYKNEKYKCFLKGKWNKKNILVLPSFTNVSYGYDLNNINHKNDNFFFIPYKELKKFEVIIYNDKEGKEYNFGKLKKLT